MITNFKIFENTESKFKKDDYVIAINLDFEYKFLKDYLENNVGKIFRIGQITSPENIEVYYPNVPKEIEDNFWMSNFFDYEEENLRLVSPEEMKILKNIDKFNI